MTDALDRDDEREDESLREIAADERQAIRKVFSDFRDALKALCVEHGIRMTGSRDYDDYNTYIEIATDAEPAGCELDIEEIDPPTPEELAERARKEAFEEEQRRLRRIATEKRLAYQKTPEFLALCEANRRIELRKREDEMRVSTDPTDPAYIDDRPRRVWLNDREIIGWTVADEFRRCVITPDGVLNGAVVIERLPEVGAAVVESVECVSSLSGISVKAEGLAPEPVSAASFAQPKVAVKPAAMTAKKRKGKK